MTFKHTYNTSDASSAKNTLLPPHEIVDFTSVSSILKNSSSCIRHSKFIISFLFVFFVLFRFSLISQTGRLVLNNNPYIVFNSAATAYLVINNSNANAIRCLPSDNCYLDGRIINNSEANKIRWYAKTSTGNYILPYYSGAMIPFGFNKTTAGTEVGAGTGYFQAAQWYTVNNGTWAAGTSLCGIAAEDDVIDRFWVIDVTGYTANPTATVRFSYNPATDDVTGGGTFPEADLLAQRWDAAAIPACKWETPPVGTAFPANDYVEVTTSSFSPWALTNKSKPLPIELLSFFGKCEKEKIILQWETAAEINNSFFTIEQSTDGENYIQIGIVQGAGNSSSALNYQFTDSHLTSHILYYRLKQTDFDGAYSYSPIIAVQNCKEYKQTTIENIYNINNHQIAVVISAEYDNKFNIAFYDAIGKKIIDEKISVQKGKNIYPLNSSSFAAGIYFARIYNESENITHKTFLK
jgi:hypothetical protein